MKKFQFNSAIAIKGVDGARIHYGTSAQSVKATFEKYGLDAMRYSMICYDEWDTIPAVLAPDGSVLAEEQPAGNRYGIRYEELLCFIISAL